MTTRTEQEILLQQMVRRRLLRGEIDRREFLSRTLMAGLGLAGVGVVGQFGRAFAQSSRPLTPTFYQWIEDLHPSIPAVNANFSDINYQIAPVEGFGIERFVAEAKNGESTWDVYVGQTPFVEMSAMIEADVIEPWDNYIPKEVIDDIIPSIREECTIDGKLYGWPFLLDVIGMGWHSGITTEAGLPDAARGGDAGTGAPRHSRQARRRCRRRSIFHPNGHARGPPRADARDRQRPGLR
jgi:hypothetical protein